MTKKEQEKLLNNIQPDSLDDRDLVYDSIDSNLPRKIDYREFAREIENQGATGSCVANATVSALELLQKKDRGVDVDLSRLFLYYNLREPYANLHGKDIGSYARDGFKFANQKGICTESTWEFDPKKVNEKPSEEAYKEALGYKVLEYKRVVWTALQRNLKNANLKYEEDLGINQMKTALKEGHPITISMTLGRGFYTLGSTKDITKHVYKGVNNDSIGGHAMNVVGYDDELQGFIVENSWGSNWGDNGFCLISYEVIKKDCNDVWVCTKFMDPETKEKELKMSIEELEKELKDLQSEKDVISKEIDSEKADLDLLTKGIETAKTEIKEFNEEILKLEKEKDTIISKLTKDKKMFYTGVAIISSVIILGFTGIFV